MVVAVVVANASVAIVEAGSINEKKNRFNLPNPYFMFLVSSLFELQKLSKNQNKSTTRPGDTGPLGLYFSRWIMQKVKKGMNNTFNERIHFTWFLIRATTIHEMIFRVITTGVLS